MPSNPSILPQAASSGPWSDEFEGPAGSRPDPAKWTFDLGNNGGWGNGELQTYTDSTVNARLDGDGHLLLRVESSAGGYPSARLKTQQRRTFQYGFWRPGSACPLAAESGRPSGCWATRSLVRTGRRPVKST
jgi:hypothetical protein